MPSARAKSDGGGLAGGCEIRNARTQHNTNCIKQGNKTSARLLPLESLAGRSGSKFFCVPGPAVQGRSSRAPSPARPSFDFDHALPRCAPRALASTSRGHMLVREFAHASHVQQVHKRGGARAAQQREMGRRGEAERDCATRLAVAFSVHLLHCVCFVI